MIEFETIAQFSLCSKSGNVPDEARRMAAYLLMDTLGVSIAANGMEAGRIAQNTARLLYGTAEPDARARMLLGAGSASLAGVA